MKSIASTPLATDETLSDELIRWGINGISLFIPSMDKMTQTAWLLGQHPALNDIIVIAIEAIVFIILIVVATLVDFYRKNF